MAQVLTDVEAFQLLQAGQQLDSKACTRIYELYADRVFRYVQAQVRDGMTSEDLVADIFVRVIENLVTFRPGAGGPAASLTAWVFKIARNRVIDHHRQSKRRPPVTLDELDALDLPDGHEQLSALDHIDLSLALQQVTEEQQAVILLRFQQDLPFGEIAQIMDKSEGAVKALHRRALGALARQLQPAPQVTKGEG